MSRFTPRKIIIASCVLLLIVACIFGYRYWFSPTHILFLNIPNAQAADITLNNDSKYIKITCRATDEVSSLAGYDAIAIFGRGLHLTEEQQVALEEEAAKGTPILTISSNATLSPLNFNITGAERVRLLQYFNNPNLTNYRNALRAIRQIATPQRLPKESFDEPIQLPNNHYYHREYGQYFETKEQLTDYLKIKGLFHENGKNIAFISGVNFPMEGNRAHVDSLISRLTNEGFNVYPIASPQGRGEMIKDLHPDAVIYYPMGRLGDDEFINWLHTENIPLFCPFPLIQSTEEWLDPMIPVSGGVLNGRILVPEIDGAMTPLAISTQNLILVDIIYILWKKSE